MPSIGSFFQSADIHPSQYRGHQTEFQVVSNRHCIPDPGFGAADIPLQLFETSLNLPPGTVILDSVLRNTQVSFRKGWPYIPAPVLGIPRPGKMVFWACCYIVWGGLVSFFPVQAVRQTGYRWNEGSFPQWYCVSMPGCRKNNLDYWSF